MENLGETSMNATKMILYAMHETNDELCSKLKIHDSKDEFLKNQMLEVIHSTWMDKNWIVVLFFFRFFSAS